MKARSDKSDLLSPAVFEQMIRERTAGSAYVLAGADTQRMDQLFLLVRSERVAPGSEDFGVEVLHAENEAVTAREIIIAADTMPFLGGFRLVWVKHANELLAEDMERLCGYVERLVAEPRADMMLVLAFTEFDGRTKFARMAKAAHIIVDCSSGEVKDLAGAARAKYGKELAPEAEELLLTLVGEDAVAARNELEKVCLYVGARTAVTLEDVLNVCVDSATRNEWALADALLEGNTARALEVLYDIRQSGTDTAFQHTIVAMTLSRLPSARAAIADGTFLKRWNEFRVSFRDKDKYNRISRYLHGLPERAVVAGLQWIMYMEIGCRAARLPQELLTDLACVVMSLPTTRTA